MTVGLVTVLYRSAAVLDGFFASLSRVKDSYVLYVVDNNETDIDLGTLKECSARHGVPYEYVPFGVNRGVAKGNNMGTQLALEHACAWIGIINNDIEFEPGILAELIAATDKYKTDVAVPKIKYFDSRNIWYGGGKFRMIAATTPHFHDGEPESAAVNVTQTTEYAPTCFMLVRASVFKAVGYFDEDYFVYYDDCDWVYRYNKLGGKIIYVGDSCVLHKVSASTGGGLSPFSVYYGTRNRLFFVRKNYSAWQTILFVLYFFCLRAPLKYVTLTQALRPVFIKGLREGLSVMSKSPVKAGQA